MKARSKGEQCLPFYFIYVYISVCLERQLAVAYLTEDSCSSCCNSSSIWNQFYITVSAPISMCLLCRRSWKISPLQYAVVLDTRDSDSVSLSAAAAATASSKASADAAESEADSLAANKKSMPCCNVAALACKPFFSFLCCLGWRKQQWSMRRLYTNSTLFQNGQP